MEGPQRKVTRFVEGGTQWTDGINTQSLNPVRVQRGISRKYQKGVYSRRVEGGVRSEALRQLLQARPPGA